VEGLVVGGGTAEYPHFDLEDRKRLIAAAARRASGKVLLLAGIGASTIFATLELGRAARDLGCNGLLLPMPHFFHYEQQDLKAFCSTVSRELRTPLILYNLPAFTNPLDSETAIQLLHEEEHIVGVKDSSGDRQNLWRLAQARGDNAFSLIVGDDALALDALEAGWDGIISGIACFVPELVLSQFRNFQGGDVGAARHFQALLDQLIEEVIKLPIPWGIRLGLEIRGIPNGPLPLPLSALRKQQIADYRDWLAHWLPAQQITLQPAHP
jgi:4-hydroxy-tetrahydrodipicolinate synthase